MKIVEKLRIGLLVLLLVAANLTLLPRAFAGTITNGSILETGTTSNVNPMIASDAQELAVQFRPATAAPSGGSIVFPAGFTVSSTQTVTGTGCTTYFPGDTAISGTPTASGSGQTITLTGAIGAASTSTTYCFLLTNASAVTNNATPGAYQVTLTLGSDSQIDAIDVLSSGANAYSVSATIVPSFTLSLGGSTDALGTLSASSTVDSTGVVATINTNAATGWFLWAEDANGTNGLTSASTSSHIAAVSTGSPHTFTTGTNQYGLGVSTNGTTNYAYGGGTTGSGLSNTAFNEIATNASPASGLTTTLHEVADIVATQPPATDYTDTITVIGAGSF